MADGRPYVGGQAVIEGVFMRAPQAVAIAVRGPGGDIRTRVDPYRPFFQRFRLFRLPLVRGAFVMVESLILGMRALTWSAEQAADEAPPEERRPAGAKERLALTGTLAFSLLAGLALFVALPHLVTDGLGRLSGVPMDVEGVAFHLVDGLVRLAVFLAYLWLIRRNAEIRRVFAYHGAEHKAIYAWERGLPLDMATARAQSRFHPRCGTSFLLFVVGISIVVFATVFPLLPTIPVENRFLLNLVQVAIKIPLALPVAAFSYEILRLSGRLWHLAPLRVLSAPGLLLQRLTTEEPDDDQLEVALTALREALAASEAAGTAEFGIEGAVFATGAAAGTAR